MTSEAFTLIYNKALDLVSRREHSRHELLQKLNKRFPETLPIICLLYTSPSPRDRSLSRMPSSA